MTIVEADIPAKSMAEKEWNSEGPPICRLVFACHQQRGPSDLPSHFPFGQI